MAFIPELSFWTRNTRNGSTATGTCWDNGSPDSTELVNKAFEAAIQQRRGVNYIREMWRQGVAAGCDISDREVLIDLASDLSLNPERFEKDLNAAELKTGECSELPFTFMEIQGKPVPENGHLKS